MVMVLIIVVIIIVTIMIMIMIMIKLLPLLLLLLIIIMVIVIVISRSPTAVEGRLRAQLRGLRPRARAGAPGHASAANRLPRGQKHGFSWLFRVIICSFVVSC